MSERCHNGRGCSVRSEPREPPPPLSGRKSLPQVLPSPGVVYDLTVPWCMFMRVRMAENPW